MYQSNETTIPTVEDFIFLMAAFQEETKETPKRRVRFSLEVASAPTNPLAFEELQNFWYSADELCIFKMEARQLAARVDNTSSDDELRGLEYTNPQRQKHRYMSIRCTLSAARRGMTADQISNVARKCTEWNSEIAFLQACHDYAQIYSPQMISNIPQIRSSPPAFPFALKSKRCADTNGDASCRRVRRRVMVQ